MYIQNGQYVSKPYYEKVYSRIPCITAQNTAEYMYPAFKINKDFEFGMLETLTSKNGYTNLAKCKLKKWHNRISVIITVIMRFGFENLYIYIKKKTVAGENFWLVR